MSNFLPLYVRHILEQTDWTPHEIAVYSVLIEKGAMDLSKIALETNIGTSSVQYALKRLHERQMVTKFLMNSKPRWKAKDLDMLRRWFKGRTQQFRMNEEAVEHFIEQYDSNPALSLPSVEFHEGMKAVKKNLQEIAERCTSKQMLIIARMEGNGNAELLSFLHEEYALLRARGIDIKVLAAGQVSMAGQEFCRSIHEHMRKAMNLPEDTDVLLHILDDAVYAMHVDGNGSCSVLMEYPQIAAMLRGVFLSLWNASGNG